MKLRLFFLTVACLLWGGISSVHTLCAESAIPFSEVYPVLEKHCVKCHGPEKVKGKLRLDTPEGLKAGGVSGTVLVAGVPEKSLLYQRIILPADDEEVMPPSGKKLSESEQNTVRNWIVAGGSFEGWNPRPPQEVVDPAIRDALLKLRAAGAYAGPRHQGASTFAVDFRLRRSPITAELWAALEPLADKLEELDLSGQILPVDTAPLLRRMSQLRRLSMRGSSAGAELLRSMPPLPALKYLNVYGCSRGPGESEESASARLTEWLRTLSALRGLHLGGGFFSQQTLAGLQAAFPNIRMVGDPVLAVPPDVTDPQKAHPLPQER